MSSQLHMHSEYSMLDGFAKPEENLKRAIEIGCKAVAITEHGNVYSHVYYGKLSKDYPDIKIIYGAELYECFDMNVQDKDNKYFHLIALAKNEKGRIALNEIITLANFEGFYNKPRIDLEHLKSYANDIVITTACLASKLSKETIYEKCIEYIKEYKTIFPYFYLEMQSHEHENQVVYNKKILQLSQDTNTPFIITCDSHAATKEDLYYQARHVQVAHDDETMTEIYEGCYIQTDEEIHSVMDKQIGKENVSLGLITTDIIADLIEDVKIPFQDPQLPDFPLQDGFKDNLSFIKHLLEEGWNKRGFNEKKSDEQSEYKRRMDYELDIIDSMEYTAYFLVVWDFINFARENNIMIAPGRGSCAGSLVCYLLGITDLDPIKYGLIFERFLNPERVSMPDTDTDTNDRGAIIRYLTDKYGEESVCQIINFSYITPIVAIKDVGRILDIPYKVCDKISKKFTYETFEECMEKNPNILDEYPQHHELFNVASHLSGRVHHVSVHAGGVGIVNTKITDYMAMKLGSDGEHVIQVDKKMIEEIGIIKFDILGVQTLGVIKEIIDDVGLSEFDININNPKFENDTKAFELLSKAQTNGVFQVESAGMKDLLLRLKPENMQELCAVISLFRPDSMNVLEGYINNKHNPNAIQYLHEDMKPIYVETFGCMVYQEQMLEVVKKFGGRTYGGADLFRKGIGKKDKKLVQDESHKLYQEIIDNGYAEDIAKTISDDLADKGGYSFNKSHGMSYAVLCLQTAYLKAHYPLYFYKALLNNNKAQTGMLNKYIIDAKQFNISVLPPSISDSDINFTVVNGKILFGLSAIKGIGESFAEQIIEERNKSSFNGMDDFIARLNPKKNQIISLIKSGAIPSKDKKQSLIRYFNSRFEQREYKPVTSIKTQKEMKEIWGIDCELIKDKNERLRLYNDKRLIQHDANEKSRYKKYVEENQKYFENQDFWEFEALSIFINDNPFEKIYDYIEPFENVEIGNMCVIVGIVANIVKKKDRNKKTFAFLNIYSTHGTVEAICWHTQLKEYEDLIKKGSRIAILCKKEGDDKVIIEEMRSYERWLKIRKITL